MVDYQSQIIKLLVEHIELTAISVLIAILIGVPLGILITYASRASKPVISVANIIQAVPSMALLGFMIPLLGIGAIPAIVAVVLYSLLPIIKSTYAGLVNINPETLEAAKGIGLTKFQVLTKVQIPLALPIIMTGIRVAAVTAVGLMTIAAFIGAGGLGYLVFSGIRTVNNYQILAGAIPACLLALTVDFLLGIVEKLVTPISLQRGDNIIKQKRRKWNIATLVVVGLLIVVLVAGSIFGGKTSNKTIAVGSKDFTEQVILGNMVSELIENRTDIDVVRKTDLGGTQVCFGALKKGDIDMYVEYTGTGYTDMLKYKPTSDMDKVYKTVKTEFKDKYDIEVLNPMAFNNTYTLAVTAKTAKEHGLSKISDMKRVADKMKSGTTFEFLNREDGLPGLEKFYGFKMSKSTALDGAPRYQAINSGKVDVIDAFATDGLLKKFKLKTLEDDKKFFPPYVAIPIIRGDTLKKYPEIGPLMKELGAKLTDQVMIDLNYKVDEEQESAPKVAKEFLAANGLI